MHRRHLVELVKHHLGDAVTLQLDNDPHAVTVRLIAQIGNTFDLLVPNQVGDLFNQSRLVNLERNLGDDDALTTGAAVLLDHRFGAHRDNPSTGAVSLVDAVSAHDEAAGREIWTRDQLKQLFDLKFRIVDHGNQAIDYLAQVVRRDLGRHTNSNTLGTVDQQVWVFAGKDQGLFERIIIVGPKLDSLLVEIVEQFMSQPVHANFGI